MERVVHRDDFVGVGSALVFGEFPCKFNPCFVGFGTAIAEEALVHIRVIDEQFRQLCLWFNVVEIGDVQEFPCLLTDGCDHVGMAMPQAVDG